ncbi:HSP20-like chaperone [Choiromyces venosus 120613-1]|uniref:HSP20-like chaperone n=1 Tax=Choiromyces venosus 120613-1 TaxID=1336337 RepID=A0A3N4JM04_9PEZI|nr:HSP20-like chaperone [Choiromyces venosus 120613-1]
MPAPAFESLFPELHYRTSPQRKAFSPRFDIRETTNVYIVEGELPGLADKSNLSVEFTDKGDLVVKGRVDRSKTIVVPQTPPSPSHETTEKEHDEAVVLTPAPSAPSSPRSLKTTVEDVPDEDEWIGIAQSPPKKPRVKKPVEKKKEQSRRKVAKEEWPKSLLSERSLGEFARSFSFPVGIDHDAVTASLEHGILRIVVPKKASGVGKRIEVR